MSDRKTISESKREFHKAFPFVIPPLYRRLADELLVELNLLCHQNNFELNGLLCAGLTEVFDTFTKGYKPNEHLNSLFDALCSSNGINASIVKEKSLKLAEEASTYDLDEIESWSNGDSNIKNSSLNSELTKIKNSDIYYSRLMGIGLITLLSKAKKNKSIDEKEVLEKAIALSSHIGFPTERLSKDVSTYQSNIKRMKQAIELMKETIAADKKKKKINSKED